MKAQLEEHFHGSFKSCLDAVLTYNVEAEKQAAAFHEQGAVEALLEMLRIFKLDEVFLRQAVKTLIPLCKQDGECTSFWRRLEERIRRWKGEGHVLVSPVVH